MLPQLYRPITSTYTCLGCGDVLPAWRGGHCDACCEWDNPGETPGIDQVDGPAETEPSEGRAPDPAEIIRTSALWLLSRGIDACTVCGDAHRPTQCPEIARAFHADPAPRRRRYRPGRHWLWNAQLYSARKRVIKVSRDPDEQPEPWPDAASALVNWNS